MKEPHPQLDSLFLAALDIESPEQRATFLNESCGTNLELRYEVERLLKSNEQSGSFLEQPAPELDATMMFRQGSSSGNVAIHAGLAAAFDQRHAVVIGRAGLSVLKNLEGTINVPRILLRDSIKDGPEPILKPQSVELPDRDSDSRYQLQGEIARGGMGAILKGRDTDLGRELAIKVLLDSHKDKPDVVQRFIEEAQIGGQLQHPGIAPVYELGQFADRRPFFSMKLVKGETLSKLLADRADPSVDRAKLVGIFEHVCQTVAYAHSRGVIHRDLKPANIMVGAFGEVQVMDWGLAKVLLAGGVADEKKARNTQLTQSLIQTLRNNTGNDQPGAVGDLGSAGSQTQVGSVMGTPAYMPPEQALGETDHLDERADVFGLGAILCEILTGKPPYTADNGTMVFRMATRGKLGECFSRLDQCGADAELIAITKHCLAVDPSDRPRDANVLTERITAYLASVETRLRVSELERAAEAARAEEALHTVAETEARAERRAKRLQLTMAAIVLVLVSIGGVAAMRSAVVQSRLKDDAINAERIAEQAREDAVKAARREQALAQEAQDLQQRESELRQQAEVREQTIQAMLYAAEMNLAGQAAEDPSGLRRVGQITANWGPDRVTRDLRGWEWSYLDALQHPDRMTIEDPHANCIAWHPDGTQLATGGRDGHIRVWDATTGKLQFELAGHSNYIFGIAWSPKGDRIASASHDQTVRIWDPVSRMACAPVQQMGAAVNAVCWSPNGQEIAAKAGGNIVISTVETGLPVKTFETLDLVSNVAWHPSQPRLASFQSVFDITSGSKLWSHPGHAMQWSPNGQRMAVAADRTAFIVSGEDGKILFELSGHSGPIQQIAWSPAGTEVATASHDDTLRVWDALTGRLLTTLRGHTDWVLGLAWSPDGKQLASISKNAIKLWDWPHRSNPTRLAMDPPATAEVTWSADGSTLAVGHDRFGLWNVDSLDQTSALDLESGGLDMTFSPAISWNSAAHLIAKKRHDMSVLIDDQTGKVRFEIPLVDTRLRSLALSPDGTRLAMSSYQQPTANDGDCGMLRLYDTTTGKPIWVAKHHGDTAGSLAWSPDGSRIAMGGWTVLAVVDAGNGELLTKNSGDYSTGWIHNIAWNPTGDQVALAHFNHTVRLIDVQEGRELNVLVGHTGDVRAVSWSPDGNRIASGGHDRTVRIWNPRSGLQMLVLPGHAAPVVSVQWSPDGTALASSDGDGVVRIWDSRIDPSRHLAAMPNPARSTPEPARSDELPLSPADIERELARMASEIESGPNSVAWLNNRGVFLARLGRWRESADDYLQVVRSMPTRRFHWGIAATPMLMAGEQDRYREHCLAMIEQFRGTTEADIADTVCKTALLVPDVVKLADLPIDELRAGASDPKWEHYRSWFIACCALISYREGQPEAAIDWARKMPDFNSQPGTLALCVRAMAEFKLGQHDDARQSLKEAEQQIPLRLRTLGTPDDNGPLPVPLGITDHDWLVAEILRRETAELLK